MLGNVIMIIIIVLLPIIPSFILFKFLPSQARVKGPFKGLKINVTGGFGGYFIIVLLLGGYFFTHPLQVMDYELWSVEGTIQLDEEDFDNMDITITIKPPDQEVQLDGKFAIDNVPIPKRLAAIKPSIIINKKGFKKVQVSLDSTSQIYTIKCVKENKKINILSPVVLKRVEKDAEEIPYSAESAHKAIPLGDSI